MVDRRREFWSAAAVDAIALIKSAILGAIGFFPSDMPFSKMPGGVPRTSTLALNKATLPFLSRLAKDGCKKALMGDSNFMAGLNVYKGNVTYKAVAEVFGHKYISPNDLIS